MRIIARMNVGGPAVEISSLMRGLDPESFEQRLVTGWCGDDEQDFLETQALDLEAVRIDGLGRAVKPWDDARVLTRMIKEIKDFSPHIVHTHTAKAGGLGRVAAKASRTGTAVVHTHHGHLLHGYFGKGKTQALVQTERILSRMTNRIVTVGDNVRDQLLQAGIGSLGQYVVIPPGLDSPALIDRHAARASLNLRSTDPVVAFVGRLAEIKRPDRFAEVVAIVHRERPDVQFVVAGDGEYRSHLQERIEREGLPIALLGWRSDVGTILSASDLVLLTSDNEGTPISLIEAGLAGLPVVSTDVGSVSEVVAEGMTGLLTSRDPATLAAAVLRLLADPAEAARMGSQGRTWCESRYSKDSIVRAHASLYESLPMRRFS